MKEADMRIVEKIAVVNPLGLHLRNAARLVLLVSRYRSEVTIKRDFQQVNAKSILGLMTLGAVRGVELEFVFNGEDAEEALKDVREFFRDGYGD